MDTNEPEPADFKELEAICEVQWFDKAYFSLKAPDAARFVAWLPNIPLREAGLEFVPRWSSIRSWDAMLSDFGAFLYPLILEERHDAVLHKALERFGYVCSRIDDPDIGPRGPSEALIIPLWERFFREGRYLHVGRVFPHGLLRVLESWTDADPFAREEAAFTKQAETMVCETLARGGLPFTLPPGGNFPWSHLCGQLVSFILPYLAAEQPPAIIGETLSQLLHMVRRAERGAVGCHRARTLCNMLMNACETAPYPFGSQGSEPDYYGGWRVDGLITLNMVLPEFRPLLDEISAQRADERLQEQSGY